VLSLLLALGLAQAGSAVVADASGMRVEADAQSLVEGAYSALAAGRLSEAARQFESLGASGAGDQALYMAGLCWYEAGELRRAEAALGQLEGPEALNLRGLVAMDRGESVQALDLLQRASTSGSLATELRAQLNLARWQLNDGRTLSARESVQDVLARAGDDEVLVREARQLLEMISATREEASPEQSGLNTVGAMLRRGSTEAAVGELARMEALANTPRRQVELGLARGALLRAQGDPDAAAGVLMDTLARSRKLGLAWETGQALFGLAIAHSLAGRLDLALTFLSEAEATARQGGFEAEAVQYGLEMGKLAIRMDRIEVAEARLLAARLALEGMDHPAAEASADELEGALRARQGRLQEALVAYQGALAYREAHGHYADAARVAVGLVRATSVSDRSEGRHWEERALVLFEQAGDPLGPAHVTLARGLARAEARDLPEALAAFALSAELAEAAGGPLVQATAERNAAKALVALGASAEQAEQAAGQGIEAAMAHQESLVLAMKAYEDGLLLYDAGQYAEARRQFQSALQRFRDLGERAYAQRADRALAWSAYNIAVSLPTEQAWPFWTELVAKAEELEDVELFARTTAAAALAADRLDQGDVPGKLRAAAELAEASGLPRVAAHCWAALAEQAIPLEDRADHARRAMLLQPEDVQAIYAVYSVSVDAYNEERFELARELAVEALPGSGELAEPLQAVIEATAGY
jgi:hypothetical protein